MNTDSSSSVLRIYGVPLSVHTRKVIVACRVKSLPAEVVPVVPVIPDSPPPDWRKISPTGLIPAIEDGDFRLADSTAIVAYLDQKQPRPRLIPSDAREQGRALFLDSWAGSALFRGVIHPLFFNQIVKPKLENQPSDAGAIAAALQTAAPEGFDYLEQLEPRRFLVGESLSIADLAVASNLVMFHYLGHRLDRERHPNLAGYFARMLAEPVFTEALENEKPFADQMGLDRTFVRA